MQKSFESAKVTVSTKKAGATILCSNLIIGNKRQIIFLTGFGPSQEVRAFAQILNVSGFELEAKDQQGQMLEQVYNCRTEQRVLTQGAISEQRLVFVTPYDHRFIVQEDMDACKEVFFRHLNQNHFVHRQWYEELFKDLSSIDPLIGSKVCLKGDLNVEKVVREGLTSGKFRFPKPTAALDIAIEENEQAK